MAARYGWIVVIAASLVFLLGILSPPRLMDDSDAVEATIARNMLESGDYVTARLDGVAYLEKSPLNFWMMASTYRVFGVHDWAARIPLALACIVLCWLTFRIGKWAFGAEAGLYAGLALATCIGLFLFTRVQIPDAMVTLAITGAIWAGQRLLEPDEERPLRWALLLGICFGAGLLLKGLIGVVFPMLAGGAYLLVTRQAFSWAAWKRLKLPLVALITIVIAAPWHVLATIRNPPYFAFSMHSGPGEYRGFFWFYFFNEHILRFLNLRYPRDYNTVPRPLFWLLNLVWLFPWSVYLPATFKLSYKPETRAGRVRLMALCWIMVVMVFFTFSTTQEYYSMPIYPAVALLVGSTLAEGGSWIRKGTRVLIAVSAVLTVILVTLLAVVWRIPVIGDISRALVQNPDMYTLSMGHMTDLTLQAFAYLKLPLAMAAFAFGVGTVLIFVCRKDRWRVALGAALMMILFFQATRVALVKFDPYLGSYPLAVALNQSPPGQLVEANTYYSFSSVFFYTDRKALIWNGRENNLEYGSYAPGAPQVFIDDSKFLPLWSSHDRYYLVAYGSEMPHVERLLGKANLYVVKENGGNYLLTNLPL